VSTDHVLLRVSEYVNPRTVTGRHNDAQAGVADNMGLSPHTSLAALNLTQAAVYGALSGRNRPAWFQGVRLAHFVPDPSAVAVSRIRRIFYCRRKSAEK